jgi:protein-S-isoprenylcysteine O-methyltransferase Ste14
MWAAFALLRLPVLFTIFNLAVFLYEEPMLESQFGESYRAYRRAVPRWGFTTRPFHQDCSNTFRLN